MSHPAHSCHIRLTPTSEHLRRASFGLPFAFSRTSHVWKDSGVMHSASDAREGAKSLKLATPINDGGEPPLPPLLRRCRCFGCLVLPIDFLSLLFCQTLCTMGVIRPQNLNDIFQAAANQARQKLPELSHNQKVRPGGPSGITIVPAALGSLETHSHLYTCHRRSLNCTALLFGSFSLGLLTAISLMIPLRTSGPALMPIAA